MAAQEEQAVNMRKTQADQAINLRKVQQEQQTAVTEQQERELDRQSRERIAAMADHTTLISKGIEAINKAQPIPTSEEKD